MNKSYETTCVHSNMLKHTSHQSIFAQDNFTFLDPGTAELVSDWVCVVGWVGGGGGEGGGRDSLVSQYWEGSSRHFFLLDPCNAPRSLRSCTILDKFICVSKFLNCQSRASLRIWSML